MGYRYSDSGSGTMLLENGLYNAGNTGRLGGTLIENTDININGKYIGMLDIPNNTGIAVGDVTPLGEGIKTILLVANNIKSIADNDFYSEAINDVSLNAQRDVAINAQRDVAINAQRDVTIYAATKFTISSPNFNFDSDLIWEVKMDNGYIVFQTLAPGNDIQFQSIRDVKIGAAQNILFQDNANNTFMIIPGTGLQDFADNAAALIGGLGIGTVYKTNDGTSTFLKIVS